MELQSSRQRLPGLDLIKVLALYFVVLYHLTFRNVPDIYAGRLADYVEYTLSTLMSVCVPLLFTVSGALALRKPVDLRHNLRRSAQVLILAVIWTFLSLVVVLALRQERLSAGEFLSVASSLKVGYIQHLWYMPTFFFLCLMTPVLQSLREKAPSVYRYGLAILMVYTFGNLLLSDLEYLLRWITGHLGYTGNREFFWYTDFFGSHYWYAFIYYALGAWLMDHREALRRHRKAAVAAIPLCTACLTLFALARCHVRGVMFDPVFNNYGSVFTLVLTASVAVLLLDLQPGPFLCCCSKSISSCSLGIYLIHWLLIEAILCYLPQIAAGNRLAPLTALVVMGLSWGLTWCFSKIPLVKNLFTVSPAWVSRKKQKNAAA